MKRITATIFLIYSLFAMTSINGMASERVCDICSNENCICLEDDTTQTPSFNKKTMNTSVGATVAVPLSSVTGFGSVALGTGFGVSFICYFRKYIVSICDKNSEKTLRKIWVRKRKNHFKVIVPRKYNGKSFVLLFDDEFVIRNEGLLLYIEIDNTEYETLISSKIYIEEEER